MTQEKIKELLDNALAPEMTNGMGYVAIQESLQETPLIGPHIDLLILSSQLEYMIDQLNVALAVVENELEKEKQ